MRLEGSLSRSLTVKGNGGEVKKGEPVVSGKRKRDIAVSEGKGFGPAQSGPHLTVLGPIPNLDNIVFTKIK